ncbi:MAG: hypothetical protein CMB97_02185 [Flavobacteriaceae bacterium]|nr:hypothetical protein [Flavobacteriaceae bacterium]
MQQRNNTTNLALAQEKIYCHPARKSSRNKTRPYSNLIPIGTPPEVLNIQDVGVRSETPTYILNDKSSEKPIDEESYFKEPYINDEYKVESFNLTNHRNEMKKLSPDFQHPRLLKCGSLYLEFRSSEKRSPYYIKTCCHSQFCPNCVDRDKRKGTRTLKTIGEALIKFAPWYHIVMTIPQKYRSHYITNERTDKFRNDCYEIIIEELGLWNDLDRFDRSGAVISNHWFGDEEPGYNYHVDMMIPAIRYGKPIENPIFDKEDGTWDKHFDKVRKRMAMRMSNDVGSKVSYKDMNFFQSVKNHTKQKTNDVSYMTRNTIKNGSKDADGITNLYEYFHDESDQVKDYLCNGRKGKKEVIYKGKLGGGELEKWYSYLGLEYDERNEGRIKEWLDENGDEMEFIGMITSSDLKGTELTKVGTNSYTLNNQKAIDEKFNDQLYHLASIPNAKLLKRTISNWKFLLQGMKINWSKNVIHKCINNNINIIENPDITTDESIKRVKKERVNLKTQRTRLENNLIRDELLMETILSGCNYQYFYDKYADSSNYLWDFLDLTDEDKIKRIKEDSLEEYNKYIDRYNRLEGKIGITQDDENIKLFKEYKRWGYRNPCTFDPGTVESIRDEERAWNKMDVEVGKYLRKYGYI